MCSVAVASRTAAATRRLAMTDASGFSPDDPSGLIRASAVHGDHPPRQRVALYASRDL
jgi:hypothetical protein